MRWKPCKSFVASSSAAVSRHKPYLELILVLSRPQPMIESMNTPKKNLSTSKTTLQLSSCINAGTLTPSPLGSTFCVAGTSRKHCSTTTTKNTRCSSMPIESSYVLWQTTTKQFSRKWSNPVSMSGYERTSRSCKSITQGISVCKTTSKWRWSCSTCKWSMASTLRGKRMAAKTSTA